MLGFPEKKRDRLIAQWRVSRAMGGIGQAFHGCGEVVPKGTRLLLVYFWGLEVVLRGGTWWAEEEVWSGRDNGKRFVDKQDI